MKLRRYALAALFLLLMGGTGASARLYVDGGWPASVPEDAPEFSDNRLAEALAAVDLSGDIDFAALKKNRAPLDAFVASLAKVSPDTAPERFKEPAAELAYWLNAYNALVLQALVDRWPDLRSPEDLWWGRFYWGLSWPVGGKRLTLRAILDKRLREPFADPRALLALHCGTKSCGPLDTTPYMGDTVDGQLNDAARRFIGDRDNVHLEGKTVHLSPLLERYQADFIAALPEGRAHILQFVWAFLPEFCKEGRACDTRGDLDRACGPRLDGCTIAWAEPETKVRARR